jgi:hypothetical protein
MTIDVARVMPTGLVVTVIGYCVWPYLFGSAQPSGPPPAAKPPEISVAMLAPVVLPLPKRDPFHETAATAARPKRTTPAPLAGVNAKGRSAPPRGTSAVGSGSGRGTKPPPKVADPLHGLALEATCLSGPERLAIISGRIYRQRETVQSPVADAPACVLAQVFSDRVLLNAQGKTLELKYSNTAGSAAARGESAAAGKQTGPTVAPRAKKSSPKSSRSKSP